MTHPDGHTDAELVREGRQEAAACAGHVCSGCEPCESLATALVGCCACTLRPSHMLLLCTA